MPKKVTRKPAPIGPTERYENSEALYKRVQWVGDLYDRYKRYWEPEIARYRRNARFAWGVNFGQWPSFVVEKLREQGRRPPTYNVTGWKVETLMGSFISNGFDIKLLPQSGKLDSLALKAQGILLSDKAHMNWDTSERVCLNNCFATAVGYERMVIDTRFHRFGNIAWEAVDPLRVLLSPRWRSPYNRKLLDYITWSRMTPLEIAETYPNVSDKLREMKEREEIEGIDYGEFQGAVPVYEDSEEKWNDYHDVIEFHFTREETYDWEYDLRNDCPFPETGFRPGSEQDRAAKIRYIELMGLDRNHDITWEDKTKRVKYVETISPTVDKELFLNNGKDIIQTNNVNLYTLGRRYRRQFKGITDELYDVNLSINRSEMNMDDIQMRSAKGAFGLDRALTGGDEELEAEIEERWNDPGARIWLDENSTKDLPNGGVMELPQGNVSADVFRLTDRRYDLADRFSLVPAAQNAMVDSAGESGRLYEHKYKAGLIGQANYRALYETHKRDKAEAACVQMKVTYAGVPREFAGVGEEDGFWVNRPMRDKMTGKRWIEDDISLLPLMKVVLTPARTGIDLRSELRDSNMRALELLKEPNDRLLRLVYQEALMESEPISDETREEARRAIHLLKVQAALAIGASIQQLQQVTMRGADQLSKMGGGAAPGAEQQPPQQLSFAEPEPGLAREGTPEQEDSALQPSIP